MFTPKKQFNLSYVLNSYVFFRIDLENLLVFPMQATHLKNILFYLRMRVLPFRVFKLQKTFLL